MKIRLIIGIGFLSTVFQVAHSSTAKFYDYKDYFDLEPEIKDSVSLNTNHKPIKLVFNGLTSSDIVKLDVSSPPSIETTECITEPSLTSPPSQEPDIKNVILQPTPANNQELDVVSIEDKYDKGRLLKNLVQMLYVAQERVQLEAVEIKKAQAVANLAQKSLEEAANHVRTITANLQNSQQEVASAAIRAQTAQLQLAAHDQLLFAARQDLDVLSTQLVGIQATEGLTQPKTTIDVTDLLEKLKQPLQESEKPTRVPSVIKISTHVTNQQQSHISQQYNDPGYKHFYYK